MLKFTVAGKSDKRQNDCHKEELDLFQAWAWMIDFGSPACKIHVLLHGDFIGGFIYF